MEAAAKRRGRWEASARGAWQAVKVWFARLGGPIVRFARWLRQDIPTALEGFNWNTFRKYWNYLRYLLVYGALAIAAVVLTRPICYVFCYLVYYAGIFFNSGLAALWRLDFDSELGQPIGQPIGPEGARNLLLALGAAIAFPFLVWRTISLHRQITVARETHLTT